MMPVERYNILLNTVISLIYLQIHSSLPRLHSSYFIVQLLAYNLSCMIIVTSFSCLIWCHCIDIAVLYRLLQVGTSLTLSVCLLKYSFENIENREF